MDPNPQPQNQAADAPKPAEPQPTAAPQPENLLDDVYDDSMEGYDKPVRKARNILYIIGALQLVGLFTIRDLYDTELYITAGVYIFFAVLFAGLAFWTKWKPYTAILTGLIIYGALVLLSAILEPETIIKGIILKIIAFSLLISGLKNAKEVQNWMELRKSRQ
ncbi:hypothetical protein [Paraflavitalea pollutisoli]|uniref:hypothetical protein n=1 Tax=Paraflavitalea pollutisoli TaxID=3034143 RepID=UPI0023ED4475|nr:hypothetical protein [Paraflavitalea sp. H1-2-19X]